MTLGLPKTLLEVQGGVMFLQGDLQSVFDALYQIGVIDPVLKMDWQEAMEKLPNHRTDFEAAVFVANRNQGDIDALVVELQQFEPKILEFLAMEVARELADYHSRTSLH